MKAIRQLPILKKPLDLNVLYHKIMFLEARIKSLTEKNETLHVSTSEGMEIIPVKKIIRCQSDNNYTNIHLKNGKKVCVSKTLKFIQSQLPENLFLRAHSSHLVNMKSIRKIFKGKDQGIELCDGNLIPISRKYERSVREVLNNKII